jgi:hypothetical protein
MGVTDDPSDNAYHDIKNSDGGITLPINSTKHDQIMAEFALNR